MKPTLFMLTQMPFENQYGRKIRLCIPGVDKGSAVWLETEISGDKQYVQKVLEDCQKSLKDGVILVTD